MRASTKKSLEMKIIAEESEKTKRSREKLKQKISKLDEKFSKKALEAKSLEIAGRIERNSSGRIPVDKDISLFDQNRNSAKMSRTVEKLAEELAKDLKK